MYYIQLQLLHVALFIQLQSVLIILYGLVLITLYILGNSLTLSHAVHMKFKICKCTAQNPFC